jgi:hypothetical protein
MRSIKRVLRLVWLVAWVGLLVGPPTFVARAATIFDTGTPTGGDTWVFSSTQYFAGQFNLPVATDITSAQGFFDNVFSGLAGTVTVEILTGTPSTGPGTVLYSQGIVLGAGATDAWYGVTGVDWVLDPGTYWLAFAPDADISGGAPSSAPDSMVKYAANGGPNIGWGGSPQQFNQFDIGMRAFGDVVTPVPATLPLFATGLGGLGLLGWRKRKARNRRL